MKAGDKKCPRCAEAVKADAKVCRFCGHEFSVAELAAATQAEQSRATAGAIGCLALVLLVGFCAWGGGESPEEKAKSAAKAADDRRKGFHCLSAWDGSHSGLVERVKAQLRDPGSFEHDETRIGPNLNGSHAVSMRYRARNGFGGMNVGIAIGQVSNATCAASQVEIADR